MLIFLGGEAAIKIYLLFTLPGERAENKEVSVAWLVRKGS